MRKLWKNCGIKRKKSKKDLQKIKKEKRLIKINLKFLRKIQAPRRIYILHA